MSERQMPAPESTTTRPPASSRIILGSDWSPASEEALDTAIQTARDWNADLAIVHAMRPLGAPGLDLSNPPTSARRNETAEPSSLRPADASERWRRRIEAAGLRCEVVTRPGRAPQVLMEEADRMGARAIVVGSRGKSGVEKAAIGSVAQELLEKSHVPVLVVPATGQGNRSLDGTPAFS